MGRKIPSKKHRGVKDPLVQQAKRLESLKGKINAPPRDPDEQPVPKSLLRLFGAERQAEQRRKKKQERPGEGIRQGRGRERERGGDGHPVAKLKRLPGETARAFSRRITGAARALHDATDAQHYPVEEEEEEDRVSRRRRRAGRGQGQGEERASRAQRRNARLQQRKKEQAQARAEAVSAARREVRFERVPFGECAHAPPALPAPRLPRATSAKPAAVPRPGRRELLLSRLLVGGGGSTEGGGGESQQAARVAAAQEQRRLDAVAAYRALKAQAHAQARGKGLKRTPHVRVPNR